MRSYRKRTWKIVFLLLWATLIAFFLANRQYITVENIITYTPENVAPAIAILLLAFAVKSVSVIIYVGILYTASGIMFELPLALLVNLIGTSVMVSIPYFIGRAGGRPVVEKLSAKYPKFSDLEAISSKNDFTVSVVTRLVSVFPSDPLSMYMGAVHSHYSNFLLGSLTGLLPDIVLYAIIGMSVSDIHSPIFAVSVALKLAFFVVSVAITLIYNKKHNRDKGIGY